MGIRCKTSSATPFCSPLNGSSVDLFGLGHSWIIQLFFLLLLLRKGLWFLGLFLRRDIMASISLKYVVSLEEMRFWSRCRQLHDATRVINWSRCCPCMMFLFVC